MYTDFPSDICRSDIDIVGSFLYNDSKKVNSLQQVMATNFLFFYKLVIHKYGF